MRWLAAGEALPTTVASGALGQVRSWAWVDRALAVITSPDTVCTPRAEAAYATLHEAVRERRAELDEAFAARLAAWSPAAGPTEDLLLVENVLERVARPLSDQAVPLIIVIDGMSAAVACGLAEDIADMRIWDEVGRRADGREGALSVLPSVTTFSRTSLLCGALHAGSQAEERAGFATFWHGRPAVLFHKADLAAGPGARLSATVNAALGDPSTVVGVILNTIDNALRDGKPGSTPTWQLRDVTYLRELLTAAASAGRPVILTSDHGHVLDQGEGIHPAASEAARHREGTPAEGEVLITGPRMLASGGGTVVLPWDERIRYTARKAGYHGGASLAEVVAPVMVFVPAGAPVPRGWARYGTPSLHEPPWWNPATGPALADGSAPPARPTTQPRKAARRPADGTGTLFTETDIPLAVSLGVRVTASMLYAAQRAFVRKSPGDPEVAAVIDALDQAGGKLPVTALSTVAGRPPFRMAGYLAQLGRLLNVDGYAVIGVTDKGRTVELNGVLLREQFLGGSG
jgi:hypothetical protein